MNAMPTPPQFWDRRAAKYARKPVPDQAAYQRTLERVRAYLGPDHSVLEVGCGTGTTALELAASARRIVATDYSAEMIAIATEKARARAVSNVEFRSCALDDAALAGQAFDVVIAMNLLHLLEAVPQELQRLHALVRPGGLFISKTPCLGDQGLALRLVIPVLQAVGAAPRVSFVSERSLTADIVAVGFAVEETGMYPLKSRSLFVVARKAP